MSFERILVGTDGSATAATAVERAVQVAAATGGSLTILHVGSNAALVESIAAQHSGSGVAIDTRVVSGDPGTVLTEIAERENYDLLVVGNKGMTGATRFFLGSVPNKVSHHARCSLMIVHTT